jgi:hypothetical protein
MSGHLLPLGYAALLRATDDPEVGVQRLEEAGAYLRGEELVCGSCGTVFGVAAAITAARAEQLEQAAVFLAEAETASDLWRGGPWLAALDEARGELAWTSGNTAEAQARLRAAGDAFAREGRKLDADRIELRLASLA